MQISGDVVEFEAFVFNHKSLDAFCDTIKESLPPESYGRPLSGYWWNLEDSLDDPERKPKLVTTEVCKFRTGNTPSDVIVQWVDGPGTFLNRSLHVEVLLPVEGGLQADIYQLDDALPDGLDECTERYRNDRGQLPYYVVSMAQKVNAGTPRIFALYKDSVVLEWSLDKATGGFSWLPHLV